MAIVNTSDYCTHALDDHPVPEFDMTIGLGGAWIRQDGLVYHIHHYEGHARAVVHLLGAGANNYRAYALGWVRLSWNGRPYHTDFGEAAVNFDPETVTVDALRSLRRSMQTLQAAGQGLYMIETDESASLAGRGEWAKAYAAISKLITEKQLAWKNTTSDAENASSDGKSKPSTEVSPDTGNMSDSLNWRIPMPVFPSSDEFSTA